MNKRIGQHQEHAIPDAQEQILEFVQDWAKAEGSGDAAGLEPLLDADFRLVGPLGFVLSKPAVLGRFRNGMQYTALSVEDLEVRFYGESTAIVIGALSQQASFQGQDSTGQFRVTLVVVRSAGNEAWVLASLHYSPMARLPAGGPPQR